MVSGSARIRVAVRGIEAGAAAEELLEFCFHVGKLAAACPNGVELAVE